MRGVQRLDEKDGSVVRGVGGFFLCMAYSYWGLRSLGAMVQRK